MTGRAAPVPVKSAAAAEAKRPAAKDREGELKVPETGAARAGHKAKSGQITAAGLNSTALRVHGAVKSTGRSPIASRSPVARLPFAAFCQTLP
jgi:hypothetical protein